MRSDRKLSIPVHKKILSSVNELRGEITTILLTIFGIFAAITIKNFVDYHISLLSVKLWGPLAATVLFATAIVMVNRYKDR